VRESSGDCEPGPHIWGILVSILPHDSPCTDLDRASRMAVNEIDYFTYAVVKRWASAETAAEALSLDANAIVECCRGKLEEVGEFRFTWASPDLPSVIKPPSVESVECTVPAEAPKKRKEVIPSPSSPEAGGSVKRIREEQLQPPLSAVESELPQPPLPPPLAPPPPALISLTTTQVSSGPSKTVMLGGVAVNAIAIGSLAWGVAYPDPSKRPSDDVVRSMIREAQSWGGITLFDTADAYSPNPPSDVGWMEEFLGRELRQASWALVASKGGMHRLGPESNQWRMLDSKSNPHPVTRFQEMVRQSHRRLGGHAPLFLWQIHHAHDDNLVNILKSVSALRAQGIVTNLGMCNLKSLDVLQRVLNQLPPGTVAAVQNKYGLFSTPKERREQERILNFCEARGIIFLAFGCFGGLDHRREKVNVQQSFPALTALGSKHRVSPYALFIAYLRHRWPNCCLPLVGCRTLGHLRDLGEALNVQLSAEEVRQVTNMLST